MKFNVYLLDGEDLKIVSSFEILESIEDQEFHQLCRQFEYDFDVLIDTEENGISVKPDEGCLNFGSCMNQISEVLKKKYGLLENRNKSPVKTSGGRDEDDESINSN